MRRLRYATNVPKRMINPTCDVSPFHINDLRHRYRTVAAAREGHLAAERDHMMVAWRGQQERAVTPRNNRETTVERGLPNDMPAVFPSAFCVRPSAFLLWRSCRHEAGAGMVQTALRW
jgi:hypothetical protein